MPSEPEAPPAATIVTQSPREIELEQTLETERQARLEAERKAMEAEDRARQLVELDSRRPNPARPAPAVPPVEPVDTRTDMEKFLDGDL